MARRLIVEIIGDASSLERSFAKAGVASEGFGGKVSGLGSKLMSFATGPGMLAGAAITLAIATALDKSVKAALAGQVSQVKLNTALKATHQSVLLMTPALNAAQDAGRKLGFTNDDTRLALAKLEIATSNTKLSIKDLGVAQDLARFKGIDLATASQTLAMAMTGSQRAVKQLGLNIAPVTTYMDRLKLAHVTTATAAGIAEVAHAKLMDKMATGNAIIQAVTDKVHGQADAYASTAQGGMAAFSAQISNLEEGLGNKLLPILNAVLQWVNAQWPTISKVFGVVFDAIGQGIDALKPFFDLFTGFLGDTADKSKVSMGSVADTFSTVFDTLKTLVSDVVTVITAIWNEFGSTIVEVVQRQLGTVISVFQDMFTAVQGVVNLIDDLIHGRWNQIWGDMEQIVKAWFDAVVTVITGAVQNVWDATTAVGKAIVDAFTAAVTGIAGGLASIISDAFNGVINAISAAATSVYNAAWSVGHAIWNAFLSGITGLADIVGGAFNNAVNAVYNAFNAVYNAAFSVGHAIWNAFLSGITGLADIVGGAFTNATNAIGNAVNAIYNAAWSTGHAIYNAFLAGITGLADIAGNALGNATNAIGNAFNAAYNAAYSVGRGVYNGVANGISGIANAVWGVVSGIDNTVSRVWGSVWKAAVSIGNALTNGIISGIGDLAGSVLKKIESIPGKILHFLGIGSPSKLMADQVGKPIAQGVIVGWTKGIGDFSTVMSGHMQAAINNSAVTITHRGTPTSPPTRIATASTAGTSTGNSGVTIMPGALVVHALDPRTAATAVVEAITVWERQNGQRYQRAA